MKAINSLAYQEGYWLQPHSMQRRFELRGEQEEVFAALEFPSAWRSRADAITADERWIFQPSGFWQTTIEVRRNEGEAALGEVKMGWTGTSATLQLGDGSRYRWRTTNFWATQFAWEAVGKAAGGAAGEGSSEENQRLIEYQWGTGDFRMGDIFKTQSRMHISPQAQGNPHLPLLAALGWYLIIRHQENTAAAAA